MVEATVLQHQHDHVLHLAAPHARRAPQVDGQQRKLPRAALVHAVDEAVQDRGVLSAQDDQGGHRTGECFCVFFPCARARAGRRGGVFCVRRAPCAVGGRGPAADALGGRVRPAREEEKEGGEEPGTGALLGLGRAARTHARTPTDV